MSFKLIPDIKQYLCIEMEKEIENGNCQIYSLQPRGLSTI